MADVTLSCRACGATFTAEARPARRPVACSELCKRRLDAERHRAERSTRAVEREAQRLDELADLVASRLADRLAARAAA